MDELWTLLLVVAVAIPMFLLVRWLAARRAVAAARRRRDGPGQSSR
ncbi:hypothetical protein ACI3EY_06005 [Ornithinimicrobium sp. LYQ92]